MASARDDLCQRRETAVLAHLAAEATADPDAILATFAYPRYELIGGSGRVDDGPAEVRRYLTDRHQTFPDLRAEVVALHHADRIVAAELWLAGTHVRRVGDVDPSGRGFRARVASFFEFDDDALVGVRAYFDIATIARQLA